jgi:hypothetical protein
MQPTKLVVRLSSIKVTRTTLALVMACVLVQVIMGADLIVLALAVIACFAALAGFRICGAYNAAAWLAFFFVLGNVVIALIAKTVMLQPLESNLYAPIESFFVLVVGSVALLIAILIALVIPLGKPVFPAVRDPRLLRALSSWALFLGALFWYINRLSQDPDGSGFGGVAVFWNLVLLAVIARTAMVMERSAGRRSIDVQLLIILLVCVVMGLIDNSKAEVALPIIAYFATSLFYRGGSTFRQVTAAGIGLVFMAALVGPMMHAYRVLGIQGMPWRQRLGLIERGAKEALATRDIGRYQKLASGEFLEGYYDYFGGGKGQMFLGRYASVQQIDPVIARVNRNGILGGSVIWPAFARLLPSVIYPNKPRYIESYGLLVHLGLIDPEGGKFPTVPLLAQSYAGYGTVGLLVIPLCTFLSFLLVLKKLGWNLYRNVFTIFFSCVFIVVYANQGDLGQYVDAVLRTFPLLAAVVWLLIRSYGVRRALHGVHAASRTAQTQVLIPSPQSAPNHESQSMG